MDRAARGDLHADQVGRECPDEPAYVEIAFERGVPAAINGVAMPLVELIASLARLPARTASAASTRREPVRRTLPEVYEAPAAVVLHAAHRELPEVVVATRSRPRSRQVSLQYADIIYNGLWFTPLREALDAFVDKVQERVTGVVRLKLFKGARTSVAVGPDADAVNAAMTSTT